MAMTPGGIARTVGLWILILAATGSALIDFTQGNSVWGWFKAGFLATGVVAFEIGRYLMHKETISTKYKKFIQAQPFWGYMSLALFALALAGLILHLAVW